MRLLLPLQIPKTPLDETCRFCNNVPIVPFTATPLPFPHGLTDPLRMAMPLKGLGLDGTLIPFFESLTPIKATPFKIDRDVVGQDRNAVAAADAGQGAGEKIRSGLADCNRIAW
jgi:hypothetical protein